MLQRKYCIGALLIFLISTTAWAQSASKFLEIKNVPQFQETLKSLKLQTQLPVIFPEKVPILSDRLYYMHAETQSNGLRYVISINTSSNCQEKSCMLGSLTAGVGENPQIYYMGNQVITVPVELAGKKVAYFTPSHAGADFWPSQIEWRDGNILYRLSWNLAAKSPEKEILIGMLNSLRKVE